jgi:hypothetical protein
VIAPSLSRELDETMERVPVVPRRDSVWTMSSIAAPPAPPGQDDWVVTNIGAAARGLDVDGIDGDDGTPIEGVIAVAPALPVADGTFVAGEIDVPAPPPERIRDTPSVEFGGPGNLLGPEGGDPDTGSRTPPIERR